MASASKGSSFERQVCGDLSRWWTYGERDDVFWRTAGSGGRATTRQQRGKQTAGGHGDIAAVDPIGEPLMRAFCFELKRGYNRDTVHHVIDRPDRAAEQVWEAFVAQAAASAEGAGAVSWAIIAKRDRREPMLWLPGSGFDFIDTPNHYGWRMSVSGRDTRRGCVYIGGEWVWALRLSEFFEVYTPEDIVRGLSC
jgi:hypothetical protein